MIALNLQMDEEGHELEPPSEGQVLSDAYVHPLLIHPYHHLNKVINTGFQDSCDRCGLRYNRNGPQQHILVLDVPSIGLSSPAGRSGRGIPTWRECVGHN